MGNKIKTQQFAEDINGEALFKPDLMPESPQTVKKKKKFCCGPTKRCLAKFSLGKYSSKLYHEGKSYHSSWIGGIVTLVCAFIFLTLSSTILIDTFSLKKYSIQDTLFNIDNSPIRNWTLSQLIETGFTYPVVRFNVYDVIHFIKYPCKNYTLRIHQDGNNGSSNYSAISFPFK